VRGARLAGRPPWPAGGRRQLHGAQADRRRRGRVQKADRADGCAGGAGRRGPQGTEGHRALKGYGGRVLSVDLSTGVTRIETLHERTARGLLGGNGLAARLLYDHVPAGTDAFAPGNAVVFGVGPITDTTVPGNSRACVASKSPLTGLFFDSTFGGRFPATLKRTGFDAVMISGRAPKPSYLSVTESGAEVKPARELWGRTTREAVNALAEAEGGDADAIAIGPAGEQRVRFAAMAHYWKNREGVSGRGGIG